MTIEEAVERLRVKRSALATESAVGVDLEAVRRFCGRELNRFLATMFREIEEIIRGIVQLVIPRFAETFCRFLESLLKYTHQPRPTIAF